VQSSWTAGKNFEPSELKRVVNMLGVRKNGFKLPLRVHDLTNANIPDTFDARTKWPKCQTIGQVRDQGACGSCWAFGAVEAMSDRICIASGGKMTNVQVSAEDLNTCCDMCGMGCGGGDPASAWQYWADTGLVTGGLYNSSVGCRPYTIASCEHHTTGPKPPCGDEGPTPPCTQQCVSGYAKKYEDDLTFGGNVYTISSDVQQIQTEIMNNGPVEADFTVYDDFPSYKSGVYVQTSDNVLGGHAIKILGWGTENNVDYWLVANSWNPDWGDKGYFKIRRGTDECGIEEDINAGEPK